MTMTCDCIRIMLVLVGDTLQGKTSKGMSLFGSTRTLKLACGPCPHGVLPSLGALDRHEVKAILFDEIRLDQVLTIRELFQANQYPQHLGSLTVVRTAQTRRWPDAPTPTRLLPTLGGVTYGPLRVGVGPNGP